MSGFNGKECHPYMVKNRISSTMLTKKVSYRCALGWNDTKSTRRVLGHLLVRSLVRSHHSFACYALVALLARSAALIRSLRCAHSLAPLLSFARSFCFCIHGDFTRTYTIYTICMKKKISFQFSFFFLAFACLEKIDNVESVFKVKYMERFFFCFFSMARENRDICAFLKWIWCLGSMSRYEYKISK